MCPALLDLPSETLHNVLKFVDPQDLGSLLLVSKNLNKYITDNTHLYKDVYNLVLDPRQDVSPRILEAELKDFVQVRRVMLGNKSIEEKSACVQLVCEVVARLLRTAHPKISRNVFQLRSWFKYDEKRDVGQRDNLEAFLCQSITYTRAQQVNLDNALQNAPSMANRQASAKLHVLNGKPRLQPRRQKYNDPYPYAVSMVYDLRHYTENTLWGPYLPDGKASVDWEKLEAIMVVLGHNLQWFSYQTHGIFKPKWKEPFVETTPYSYEYAPYKPGTKHTPDFEDPYNVTGGYTRVVCFLDYHDLFRYNFTSDDPPPGQPRPPLDDEEALRLIHMELKAIRREDPGPDDHPDYPVVYFEGESRSLHRDPGQDAQSKLKGWVRMTKEKEVRWQSISTYGDEERWGSEGIQVGGIQSARGVLGHWFDRHHRETGPVGPTAFWKVSDLHDIISGEPSPHEEEDEEEANEDEYDDGEDALG